MRAVTSLTTLLRSVDSNWFCNVFEFLDSIELDFRCFVMFVS